MLVFLSWDHPPISHTDASSVEAGMVLTQVIDDIELMISFASHHFSKTDASREPAARECMTVLHAVGHHRQHLTGRPFTLVTDSSAFRWLFHSIGDLSAKLHR